MAHIKAYCGRSDHMQTDDVIALWRIYRAYSESHA